MSLDELALQLANRELEKGFDAEAYIVKYIAELKLDDKVPQSDIDDCIKLLLDLFTTYYNSKSVTTLRPMLDTLTQIISELYHTCKTTEELHCFGDFMHMLQKIII